MIRQTRPSAIGTDAGAWSPTAPAEEDAMASTGSHGQDDRVSAFILRRDPELAS